MLRKFLAPFAIGLLLLQLIPVEAFAQKGGGSRSSSSSSSSSSGRSSFSGGSSSSGRSSSSSSSGRSSFSGGSSSSSGRSSFSGGSSSSKPSSSSGKSSFSGGSSSSSSSGKSSFSGGSSSSSSGNKSAFGGSSSSSGNKSSFSGGSSSSPPSSGNKSAFGGSSSSSGNKSSFSGGSSSSSKPASSSGKSSFSGGSSSSGKTTTTTPIAGKTPASVSKQPAASSFDKLASNDSKKAESRANYEKASTPASSYKTPAGKEVKIDPKDKQISYLQGRLDQQKWVNRNDRTTNFYSSYHNRPLVVYNDCYHPYWNYWLLSQSLDTMSMWCYHHRASMDQARLNAMYAQNAGLQARVAALEAQRVPVNPTYVPPNVDPDLTYNDNYVNAAYNPQPKTVTVYEYGPDSNVGHVLLWIFVYIPLMALGVWLVLYLLFIRTY